MQTIIELPEFLREARRLMDDSAIDDLKIFLSSHPYAGDLLTGTGGVRKLRWRASADKGKSGGVQVIYFFYHQNSPLLLLSVYSKSTKDNLSKKQLNSLKKITQKIRSIRSPS
ncbi:MAG: type II toxin-antitoxin system RelE/ParE family toxin [Pseudomonadales bacterium]|jgi:hypothetical protein